MLGDSKLCVLLAQGIVAAKKGSLERRVLRGCLCTAALAIHCQLLLSAACNEKCGKSDNSCSEKTDDEPVASTAVDDVNGNVPLPGEDTLASSTPCNRGSVEAPQKRHRSGDR